MHDPVLSRRALNRALLARQMLLERVDLPIERAVQHLIALQAQEPWDPYYQLWSRLCGFDPNELAVAILGPHVSCLARRASPE